MGQQNRRPEPSREDQDLVPNDPQADPADLTPTRLPDDPDPYADTDDDEDDDFEDVDAGEDDDDDEDDDFAKVDDDD